MKSILIAPPPPPTSDWTDYERTTVKMVNSPDACPICGGAGYCRYDVPVDHPNFGKLDPCDCKVQKRTEIRRQQSQLEGWLAEATFQNYTTNDFDQAALQAAREFAQNPRAWLTLWGNYGNGKSHLLAAVANHCQTQGIDAIYYTLPDLLDLLRKSYARGDYDPFFEQLCTIPVLALDEVDKVHLTGWAAEKIYQLADKRYRYLDKLATLFALNQDPRSLLQASTGSSLGHLFSRMYDQRSQVIHLAGPDARPVVKTLRASLLDSKAD